MLPVGGACLTTAHHTGHALVITSYLLPMPQPARHMTTASVIIMSTTTLSSPLKRPLNNAFDGIGRPAISSTAGSLAAPSTRDRSACPCHLNNTGACMQIFLHTDAAQAVGKIPVSVNDLNIDLMSISGHKLYGPKGIGALYVRRRPRVRLEPQMSGGGQERGLRSGTVPTPLAVGLGAACEVASQVRNPPFNCPVTLHTAIATPSCPDAIPHPHN